MILEIFLSITLAILTAVVIFVLVLKRNRAERLLQKFPGPKIYPLIGNAWETSVPNDELTGLVFKFRKLYGDRYRLNFGLKDMVVLAKPEDIEKLLSSSQTIQKGITYNLFWSWLGDGLLTSKGSKWQHRRKMLTPAFHFKILENFVVIFNEQSNVLVKVLADEFKNAQENDICPPITRCALDIISETAMGIKLESQGNPETLYVKSVYKACEILQFRALRPWYWIDTIFNMNPMARESNSALNTLHTFTKKVIQDRKSMYNPKAKSNDDDVFWLGKRRLAFLDLLLEAQRDPGNNLSDRDIREEVDTFLFEGHDTTSASLVWTTFLLGCYPEHQAKLHAELDTIFGNDRTRPITTTDLVEMKYLEMCIKESLRLYPSVPFISRYLTSDFALDKEFIIPKGTDVVLLSMSIHRNAEVFPEPEHFNPERFLPDNCTQRNPFAYIPFSAGPRNCIGQKFAMMEEKIVLTNIFRNFKVESVQKPEDVTVMMEVVTRPKDGLKVRIIPREE